MTVGNPDWHTRLPGNPPIPEGQAMENIQMDHVVSPLRQKLPEQSVIFNDSVLSPRKLIKPDTLIFQRLSKNAVLYLRRDNVHLQFGEVHVQQHIAEEGFNPSGFPPLAEAADPYWLHCSLIPSNGKLFLFHHALHSLLHQQGGVALHSGFRGQVQLPQAPRISFFPWHLHLFTEVPDHRGHIDPVHGTSVPGLENRSEIITFSLYKIQKLLLEAPGNATICLYLFLSQMIFPSRTASAVTFSSS